MINALYPNVLADHDWIPNTRERETPTLNNHASDHSKYAAEIVAIERHLGLNPAGGFETVVDRLNDYGSRIGVLEQPTDSNFVSRSGDVMTGALTVPGFVIGNIANNLEGIKFNQYGYIQPLDNFTTNAFKVQNINGITLFEVPFDGSDVKLANGATVLSSANHSHRSDPANDIRYFLRTDDIGHRITLRGSDETYQEFVVGNEGTQNLQLLTMDYNHFKIRTSGASVNLELLGIPPRNKRRGITICLQNVGSTPATMTLLNSHTWADFSPAPDLTTNGGRDTEIFAYTIGEGDRWVVHPYYINAEVRSPAGVYPEELKHYFKFFGRSTSTPLTITDEKTATIMNLVNGVQVSVEGAEVRATGTRYMVTDKVTGLSLQNPLTVVSIVKNISVVEEFAVLGSIASSARLTNYLRADKLSSQRLRARLSSQTGSYDNGTDQTPALPIASGTDTWTMIAATKEAGGYSVTNVNSLAQGFQAEEYRAYRAFPNPAPAFDAAGDMRVGVGILPRSTYTTSPTGLGTFVCAAVLVLEGDVTNVELMNTYRAIRQEMLGIGISSLPAPTI